jgi:2-polyprenyl-3-methyl-5-hydroxy-6-metoxy-1,4-benzoquinol methylase
LKINTVTGQSNLQKHLNPNPIGRWLVRRFHKRIIGLVRAAGASRILDAGCGEGFTLRELHSDGIQAAMLGTDISHVALAWNQANQMSSSPLAVADVRHLPFSPGSFDLVVCLEVLEHVPDAAAGLSELLRVSRGHVLISVPHEPFFRGANFLRGKYLRTLGNNPEHVHTYSGRALRRLMSAQAEVVWHGYVFPWQIALACKKR